MYIRKGLIKALYHGTRAHRCFWTGRTHGLRGADRNINLCAAMFTIEGP